MENLKIIQEYLKANGLEDTLFSLRQQLYISNNTKNNKNGQGSVTSQTNNIIQPSQQLLKIINQSNMEMIQEIQLSHKNSKFQSKQRQKQKQKQKLVLNSKRSLHQKQNTNTKTISINHQRIVQGLLGKIAYSNKLLEDPSTNLKIDKLMNSNNKIFQKAAGKLFPNMSMINENRSLYQGQQQNQDDQKNINYNYDCHHSNFIQNYEGLPSFNNMNNINKNKNKNGNVNVNIKNNIDHHNQNNNHNNIYYQDQLQFATSTKTNLHKNTKKTQQQNYHSNNQISPIILNNNSKTYLSNIQIQNDQSSILSQPSFILQQLNKQIDYQDQYNDDNDLGYHLLIFQDYQLEAGCAQITKKYGYPQCAILKNTKKRPIINNNGNSLPNFGNKKQKQKNQINKLNKFPQGVNFPTFSKNDNTYPIEFDKTVYDCMKLKVIFDRDKTGYQESQEIQFFENQQQLQQQYEGEEEISKGSHLNHTKKISKKNILAGKYKIISILGSGVFAKVLKAINLTNNQQTCLKMISNNRDPQTNQPTKDFFDQALDQIKLLSYIKVNCNTDQNYLLTLKNYFYHREHLFLQTDLLKDNLYIAYKKNPHFFSISVIKQISRQILQAVSVLHSLHIMHADLKPQNILIKSYDNPIEIKVIDLGNSCFFHDHLGSYVQSRSYRAPEVVLGLEYSQKIDIWSVGCILAQLWTKNVLFYNHHIPGMLARIQSIMGPWPQWMLQTGKACANYFSKQNLIFMQNNLNQQHHQQQQHLNSSNKMNILIPKKTCLGNRIRTDDGMFLDFLNDLLRLDPNLRLSAKQALKHPFLIY